MGELKKPETTFSATNTFVKWSAITEVYDSPPSMDGRGPTLSTFVFFHGFLWTKGEASSVKQGLLVPFAYDAQHPTLAHMAFLIVVGF